MNQNSDNTPRNGENTPKKNVPAPAPGAQVKKRKKKKSMGRWAAGCTLYLILILIISVVLSYLALTMANDMFALIKPSETVVIEIKTTDKLGDVTKKLKDEGVVEYGFLFQLYASVKKFDEKKLNPGVYEVDTNTPYSMLLSRIQKKATQTAKDTVMVTIPEGYELWQIVKLLEDEGVCSKEDLMETINNYDFKHAFLQDIPFRENRLEGYLFPDTYEFYVGDTSVSVINRMLNNFNDKFNYDFYDRADELEMTLDEVVVLASLIEREAASDEERGLIGSVFHNRLANSDYPYLESCASIQYILGERKAVLSIADTKIVSPYNTYINRGLPPAPIASPGLASIKAALYPEESDYLFFVANPEGASFFSKTYDEHLANTKKANDIREKMENE